MSIPNRLLFYRELHRLLQTDVAQALGLASTDRISRWEQGQAFPHLLNLFKLAHLYRVAPQDLYPELYAEIGRALDATTGSPPP